MSDQPLAVQQPSAISIVQQMVQQGLTRPEQVAALREMMAMVKEEKAEQARREYLVAFGRMQNEIPVIEKTTIVPTKAGGKKFDYAKYEDMMPQIQPVLTRHGFNVRFDQEIIGDRLHVLCYIQHENGHCEPPNRFTVPLDAKGAPDTNSAQAIAGYATSAKRHALMNALNIVTRGMDNDARNVGSDIPKEQADEIFQRANTLYPVEKGGAYEKWHRDLLEYAGVETALDQPVDIHDYRRIQTGRVREVLEFLDDAEKKKGVRK